MHNAKELYNWHDVENALAKKLHITPAAVNTFFYFVFSQHHDNIAGYLDKVKDGSITKRNALQYWLNKIPFYEDLYKTKYPAFIESERIKNENELAARQGNNAVQTGGPNCNNLDFSTGTTAGWVGQWNNVGNFPGANSYGALTATGLNSAGFNDFTYVHELNNSGNDPNVPISTLPPGHAFSLRLGNDSAYRTLVATNNNASTLPYNHQIISNTFLVTQLNEAVTYWYAVVLCQYNPNNHAATIQPYFKIRMYDGNGIEIQCAHYDVDALTAPNIGGFQLNSTQIYDASSGTFSQYDFYYKNWSPVMIPLRNYIGQNVTLTFETSDCAGGGHPGYAYVAADCAPFPGITFTPFSCGMNTTVLTAPPGVATYSWSGPGIVGSATNQTITINAGGTYSVTMTTLGNSGINCTLQIDTFIQGVPPLPVASFTTVPVCIGNPTPFTNLSTGGPFSTQIWNFGDGTIDSVNASPTHIYSSVGTYTVSLYVNNGCTNTYTTTVTVNPGATASFNAAPVCRGTLTVFNNTSIGGSTYNWNFGDGSAASTTQSPTHTYATAGVFAVTLTVTTSFGCKFIVTNSITVNVMPVAGFNAPQACLGVPTVFNNTSTPTTGVNHSWNFGDLTATNDTSNLQNPTYTYPAIGTYTVLLQLSTPAGCSSAVNAIINVNPIPNIILSSPPPYCWGDFVAQTNYTVNPNSTSVTYSWNNNNTQIGLGSSGAGIPSAFTAGMNTTSSNISGIITVVPTLNGCSGPPATFTITIKPTLIVSHPSVDYCPNNITSQLTFTASPVGSSLTWINTTPGTNIGLATMNGTTTLPSFTTIDPSPNMASNIISLQAVLNGCTGPLSTFAINVNPNPVASFTNSIACEGTGTNFYDQSTIGSGIINQWNWDMNNDGIFTDATNQNPAYILTPVGNHTVSLIVTSNKGCKDSVTNVVYVNPRPVVVFVADTLSGCTPLTVNFKDSCYVMAPDKIVKWIWDFGNSTTQTDTSSLITSATYTNPLHTQNISYIVSLTAITNVGCASKLTKNWYITVNPIPLAGFSWSPTDADILDPLIHFHDQSEGATGPNAYLWNFGDVFISGEASNYSTLANPTHLYNDEVPYTYLATQVVQNVYGCKDSITERIIIKPVVTFYAPNAFTPNFDELNDGFKGTGIGIDNSTFNMWIYDRWGMEIFHSTDLETSWDGKVRGKGEISQEDTYVWKVTFKDILTNEHVYKGIVNLIK